MDLRKTKDELDLALTNSSLKQQASMFKLCLNHCFSGI